VDNGSNPGNTAQLAAALHQDRGAPRQHRPQTDLPSFLSSWPVEEIYAWESTPGSTAGLNHPELTLIRTRKNLGYTGGNNVGVAYELRAHQPAYVLILNNDVLVTPDMLDRLVEAGQAQARVALLQPTVQGPAEIQATTLGLQCDRFGATYPRSHSKEGPLFYASGACLLIRRELIEARQGRCFDDTLFAYHDDLDLAWHARLLGYGIDCVPGASCWHAQGTTAGPMSPWMCYLIQRNRLRVLVKHQQYSTLLWTLPAALLLQQVTAVARSWYSRDPHYLAVPVQALFWNLRRLRSTLRLRRHIQPQRCLPDRLIARHQARRSLDLARILRRLGRRPPRAVHFPGPPRPTASPPPRSTC